MGFLYHKVRAQNHLLWEVKGWWWKEHAPPYHTCGGQRPACVIASLLLPCEPQGLNSGRQACWQVPLRAELSYWPSPPFLNSQGFQDSVSACRKNCLAMTTLLDGWKGKGKLQKKNEHLILNCPKGGFNSQQSRLAYRSTGGSLELFSCHPNPRLPHSQGHNDSNSELTHTLE